MTPCFICGRGGGRHDHDTTYPFAYCADCGTSYTAHLRCADSPQAASAAKMFQAEHVCRRPTRRPTRSLRERARGG